MYLHLNKLKRHKSLTVLIDIICDMSNSHFKPTNQIQVAFFKYKS